jgi:hypothetical protein
VPVGRKVPIALLLILVFAVLLPATAWATAPAPLSGYTRYEGESGAPITYTGSWYTSLFNSIYSGGYETYSPPPPWTGTGGTATMYFKGTDLMWLAPMNYARGIARVTIDTSTPELVDCYSAVNDVYVVKQYHGLPDTQHKIVIEWTGTQNPLSTYANVAVDAIDVKGIGSSGVSTITASAGANGSITPAGPTGVAWNGSQAYSITPLSGSYAVSDVLVNGVSVGPVTSYTFNNVVSDQTISATFVGVPTATPASSPWSIALIVLGGLGVAGVATRRHLVRTR